MGSDTRDALTKCSLKLGTLATNTYLTCLERLLEYLRENTAAINESELALALEVGALQHRLEAVHEAMERVFGMNSVV